MVFVKNWKFKNCFVLIKKSLEEVSGDNLYSKNAIPNKKTVDLNKKCFHNTLYYLTWITMVTKI